MFTETQLIEHHLGPHQIVEVPVGRPAADRPKRLARPAPFTVQVRCQGQRHVLRFSRHGVQCLSHTRADLRFLAALKAPCRCLEILQVLRSHPAQPGHERALPPAIAAALRVRKDVRTRLGHGSATPHRVTAWDSDQAQVLERALQRWLDRQRNRLAERRLILDTTYGTVRVRPYGEVPAIRRVRLSRTLPFPDFFRAPHA